MWKIQQLELTPFWLGGFNKISFIKFLKKFLPSILQISFPNLAVIQFFHSTYSVLSALVWVPPSTWTVMWVQLIYLWSDLGNTRGKGKGDKEGRREAEAWTRRAATGPAREVSWGQRSRRRRPQRGPAAGEGARAEVAGGGGTEGVSSCSSSFFLQTRALDIHRPSLPTCQPPRRYPDLGDGGGGACLLLTLHPGIGD